MSQSHGRFTFIAAFVLCFFWSLGHADASPNSQSCASIASFPVIGSSEGHLTTPAEPLCFVTDLPTAGLWLVDAGIDLSFRDEARLDLLGSACDPSIDAAAWRVVGRSADSAVVEVRSAGRYSFCVSGRHPAATVGVRLRSSFVGLGFDATCTDPLGCPPPPDYDPEYEPDPDPIVLAGGLVDGCTDPLGCPPPPDYDPEYEPDPDPFVLAGGLVDGTCTDPLGCPPPPDYDPEYEPDPDPFRWIDASCLDSKVRIASAWDTTCTDPLGCPPPPDYDPEYEPDPDPILTRGSCRKAEALRVACDRLRTDDHGDIELCASRLGGESVRGRLSAGDTDVFRIDVTSWQTLQVAARGAVTGAVYNRQGHRLGNLKDSTRWVETLGPGTYFVHIQGDGAYELAATDAGRFGASAGPAF